MVLALTDSFGRQVRDLRVSVTDRCNLRCTYCMPHEDMRWLPRSELLTFEEIERLVGIFTLRFGIGTVRLTGGEPTVRARLPELVSRLARFGAELSMTTNGTTLGRLAGPLRQAGLSRVTVSLDSLQPERFAAITGRDVLGQVLEGIDAALVAGLHPVKVNTVLVRGVNDDELLDLADFGRQRGVEVRFIEFMPLDGDSQWSESQVVTADEVVARIGAVFPLQAARAAVALGPEPAERYLYQDGRGSFGVIASVTRTFCSRCDRARLTAEGALRSCLFSVHERDLRALLHAGADDDQIAAAIADEVAAKWAGHAIGRVNFVRPARSMSQIGG